MPERFPKLLSSLLIVLGAVFLCQSLGDAETTSPVAVYYFHSTARCAECLNIERMAEETLRREFADQLAGGQLSWRSINADLPENTHFVFDYELSANELVVAKTLNNQTVVWKKLAEVWSLATDPETFRVRLVTLINEMLAAHP